GGLRPMAGACAAAMAVVALVAAVTIQTDGFLDRYPRQLRALMMPPTALDWPEADESKNTAGPLVVAYGDSNAQHLYPGFVVLQRERTFRFKLMQFIRCAPYEDARPAEAADCHNQQVAMDQELARLKPDIVVIGALWPKYTHVERLSERLQFFQQIGVRRI